MEISSASLTTDSSPVPAKILPLTFDGTEGTLPSTFDRKTHMEKPALLQGTLDMLILKVLSRESTHGFGICQCIQKWSDDVLSVGEGSLYPALYRLQDQGWIESEWGISE